MISGWTSGPWIAAILAAGRVDTGTVYYMGLAVVIVVLMVALVVFYRTWTEVNEEIGSDSPEDLYESFREAHAAGQIDDRELERVRSLLGAGDGAQIAADRPTPSAAGAGGDGACATIGEQDGDGPGRSESRPA